MEICICKPYNEFAVDLASKQSIHALRKKLYHAQSIILNMQDILGAIKIYGNKVIVACTLSVDAQQDFEERLENMQSEVRNHSRTISKLLKISQETKVMVCTLILPVCQSSIEHAQVNHQC